MPVAIGARERRIVHDRIEIIDIREDDVGALAAELERYRHQALRARRGHDTADLAAAGESELGDAAMRRQCRAGLFAYARHHIDDAGREYLCDVLAELHGRERGVLVRLQDDGIARGECRRQLEGRHDGGHVPRNDLATNPDRLTAGDEIAARDRLTEILEAYDRGSKEAILPDGEAVIERGLEQGSADVESRRSSRAAANPLPETPRA